MRLEELLACVMVAWLPVAARSAVLVAQAPGPAPDPAPQAEPSPQGEPPPPEPATEPPPPVSPPSAAPPAARSPPPPPPQAEAQAAPRPAPQGQWIYTQQYGWVWQAYADSYTYVPPDGYGEPLTYVYYPTYGWRWVVAPWVWGIGPWPYFGVRGAVRFGWYGHGWWRTPARWHYRPVPVRGGIYAHGIRAAPPRARVVERRHEQRREERHERR